jgi:hypothetical protein
MATYDPRQLRIDCHDDDHERKRINQRLVEQASRQVAVQRFCRRCGKDTPPSQMRFYRSGKKTHSWMCSSCYDTATK